MTTNKSSDKDQPGTDRLAAGADTSRNARALLIAYLGAIREPEKAAALFAPDGVIELPYLASLGMAHRVQGRDEIHDFVKGLLAAVPDYSFQEPQIFIETSDQVFAEYSVEAVTADGRPFVQHYAGRLVARNGAITLIRESLDLVLAGRAMLPGGMTADGRVRIQ